MARRLLIVLLALVLGSSLLASPSAGAAPHARERCFTETGHCVSGAILDYWEKNGGLRVFGYPIGDLRTESNRDGWSGPTQWFERDRLEDHANEGYGVLAGRLGAQYLQDRGKPWQQYEHPQINGPINRDCRYFDLTGHMICGTFKRYWEQNGGLMRFGYPITEAFQEDLPEFSGTVQYFERRRLEYHPELAGTSYEVLLGLLGNELMDPWACKTIIRDLQKTAARDTASFGCAMGDPYSTRVNFPISTQPFEHGSMVWVQGPNNSMGTLWVIYVDQQYGTLVWQIYADTWKEGEPLSGGETPPPGRYEPTRGFGKLWREMPGVRDVLGWATAPETPDRGHQQQFRSGAWLLYRRASDRVYLLYPGHHAEDVVRVQ